MNAIRNWSFAFVAFLAVSARRSPAQATSAASAGVAIPAPKTQVISIQPLHAVLSVLAVEYEHTLSETVTLGVGTTYWGTSVCNCDFSYFSGDLKLRYYPSAKPLEGFSVGVSAGATHIVESTNNGLSGGNATAASVGTLLEYAWLMGRTKSFYVAVGAGAKALLIGQNTFSSGLTVRYPTVRLSVGWAF